MRGFYLSATFGDVFAAVEFSLAWIAEILQVVPS